MSCARCSRRRSAQHGLAVDPRHAGTFFEQLRLLSGRLAFKLASATRDASGPRCSAWRSPGCTWTTRARSTDQIVVPLDDHLELYRDARRGRAGARRGREPSAHGPGAVEPGRAAADDHLPPRRGEVLQRGARGRPASSSSRCGSPTQLARSQEVLASGSTRPTALADRPDRAVRNAELAGLLRFYLGPGGPARDDARRRGGRGRMAAREPRQRPLPAAVHPHRPDLRPVGRGGRARRRKAGSSTTGSGATSSRSCSRRCRPIRVLAAEGAALVSLSSLDVSLPRLADAAFRAPERSHETPDGAGRRLVD